VGCEPLKQGEKVGELQNAGLNGKTKDEVRADIATKIQALDNPVKLHILASLVDAGSLSITDIARKLNINFSTAHKYLEQLQAAGLVTSKQISDNRLKRMFFVKDFRIDLSPKSLFQKNSEASAKSKSEFKIFDNFGNLVEFDEEKFSQKYIKRGMPRGTVILALQEVLPQAYDGITLLEMRHMFRDVLKRKSENIDTVIRQLDEDLNHKRTFAHLLGIVHPEALQQHAKGEIFIRNLGQPHLLNIVHDLEGLSMHGISKVVPKTAREFFEQIFGAISQCNFVSGPHTLSNFSAVLNKFKPDNVALEAFFEKLDSLGIKFYVEVNVGIDEERENANAVMENFRNKRFKNLQLVLKFRSKNINKEDFSGLKNFSAINLSNGTECTTSGNVIFDSNWRDVFGTYRTGEVQEITINLPKLALEAKTGEEFQKRVLMQVAQCREYCLNMAELIFGTFFRKYDVKRPSAIKGYWTYATPQDFVYSIALCGVHEAADMLKLGEKDILELMKQVQKYLKPADKTSIRFLIKECVNAETQSRFSKLIGSNKVGKAFEHKLSGICKIRKVSSEECKKLVQEKKFEPGVLYVV
jgi:DNA-binding transcriptional ArsR family regulator